MNKEFRGSSWISLVTVLVIGTLMMQEEESAERKVNRLIAIVLFAISALAVVGLVKLVKYLHKKHFLLRIFKPGAVWDDTKKNATLTVNGHFQPKTRIGLEKAINDFLEKAKVGKVLGGKCIYKGRMEVDYCEIYLSLKYENPRLIEWIAKQFNRWWNFPRGSMIEGFKTAFRVGTLGGLACYLDVSELKYEEYGESYQQMLKNIGEALGEKCSYGGLWIAANDGNYERDEEGMKAYQENNPTIVGLYYYGGNYPELKEIIEPIIKETAFGSVCRFEQCC